MATFKTYQIKVIGCKVNQYEGQQISEFLSALGLRRARPGQRADVSVVHSCAVTSKALAKSRRAVGSLAASSDGAVVLSGCAARGAQVPPTKLSGKITVVSNVQDIAGVLSGILKNQDDPNVSFAIIGQGNKAHGRDKQRMMTRLTASAGGMSVMPLSNDIQTDRPEQVKHKIEDCDPFNKAPNHTNKAHLGPITTFAGHQRAFLKVQDGCDAFCSYCLVPYLRPKVSYRPIAQILEEVSQLVENGYREVVLAGVHLGAYGQNTTVPSPWNRNDSPSLAKLLAQVASVPGLQRVRLSSLEPNEVTEDLLKVMAYNSNVAKHLHLPLQSGSGRILRAMGRQYTPSQFLKTVESARSRCSQLTVTTDVIVGFPGESDADFQASLSLARKVGFGRMHVFGFSARKGTAAARMGRQVPAAIRKQRSQQMRMLGEQLAHECQNHLIGQKLDVLVESRPSPDGLACGLCEQYFTVRFEAQDDLTGQIVPVLLEEIDQLGPRGMLMQVSPQAFDRTNIQRLEVRGISENRSVLRR